MSNIAKNTDILVQYINSLIRTGAQAINTNPGETPPPEAGMFASGLPEWKEGETYTLGQLFQYQGNAGYCKQPSLTAQEIYPPFSTGTESLYGARPRPDAEGIYPYVYNMGIYSGMRVRGNDGKIYRSKSGTQEKLTELLYPPEEASSLFDLEE